MAVRMVVFVASGRFVRISDMTRKRMIQPQAAATERTARSSDWGNDSGFDFADSAFLKHFPGKEMATNSAEIICMPHKTHGMIGFRNSPDRIPKINEGPALLQNASILCAVSFEIFLSSYN